MERLDFVISYMRKANYFSGSQGNILFLNRYDPHNHKRDFQTNAFLFFWVGGS